MSVKKSEDKLELPESLHLSLITLDHPDFQSTMAAAFLLSSVAHISLCPALAQNHTREEDSGIYIFHLSVDINCPNLGSPFGRYCI